MTDLLTTMRQRLEEAESDAERLRAAIQILEQSETGNPSPRRARRRSQSAAATATATSQSRATQRDQEPAAAATEPTKPAEAPAPTTAGSTPRKRKPAAKRPVKSVVPLEKLLKLVGESPGLTTTAIAKETGGDQSALLELLKESEQKGEVRRRGQRRATSWYRITDEDRIAARAAEIAAQSKSSGAQASPKPARRKVPAVG